MTLPALRITSARTLCQASPHDRREGFQGASLRARTDTASGRPDLLAVAILPTVLALVMPGLNLLFDIPASENRYRWRTFATHALVPALIGTAAARILAPFSWTAGAVTVIAGYVISVRMYYQCCNDWVAVPDQRRLQASALFLGALMVYGLVAALLFQAGLIP